jgi:transmembrane sensor
MSHSIRQQAAEWFVEFRTAEPGARARKAFLAWLKESPAHMSAYLEMASIWEQSGALEARSKWPMEALLEEARSDDRNVVTLDLHSGRERANPPHRRRPWTQAVGLAACLLVFLGTAVSGWLYWNRDTYATAIGEQRSVVLRDGSTVELNARSRVRIRFTDRERHVDLLEGQALFTVAKNKKWPFVVNSQGTRVRAVGTQFDVHLGASGTTVTVLEGTVAVTPQPLVGRNPPSLIDAGQQMVIGAKGPPRKVPIANLDAATAWTRRQLIFDNTPLQDVATEFNRYNRRQLVIRNPTLRQLAIDGVFSSTDPASLLHFLETRPGITVEESGTDIIVDAR